MGTFFSISAAVAQNSDQVDQALKEAFAEVSRVEQLMTTWKADSHLSKVNANAGKAPVVVPREIIDLVEKAGHISDLTRGKFDITFASIGGLWDFKSPTPKLPDPDELARRVALIDYKQIAIDREKSTLYLPRAGMRMSLGAIAKGYGVDRAARVLLKRGIKDFIVYGGGDLFISGKKGDQPWAVGIQDPRDRSRYFARFEMTEDRAIVTSGDYEKYFVKDGRRYHHIMDPDTGYPTKETVSVTVIAPSTADADGLATGILVLGLEAGMKVLESNEKLEGIIVDEKFEVHVSTGLKDKLELSPITKETDQGTL
jgi:thiamine biosynthesis lipoprotein